MQSLAVQATKSPLAVLAVGLLLLVPNAYAAEEDDSVERARAAFNQGVGFYKDGKFADALAAFQEAYETRKTYRVLYNIARTYFELQDYVNAYRTLKDYVKQGGDEISDERRAQVVELSEKLQERIASLTIACNVADAEFRVDGIVVGRSPLPSPVLVHAGSRRISAALPGYAVVTRTVTLAGGQEATVRLELSAPTKAPASEPTIVLAPEPALDSHAPPAPLATPKPQRPFLGTGFLVSATVAGGCAIAAGIFGWQMASAKDDFDRESAKPIYDRVAIEYARSRARTYQYLTWGFGSATLLAGGAALYLALSGERVSGRSRGPKTKQALLLAPTAGGMVLSGWW